MALPVMIGGMTVGFVMTEAIIAGQEMITTVLADITTATGRVMKNVVIITIRIGMLSGPMPIADTPPIIRKRGVDIPVEEEVATIQ
eukprot:CAMPEP_0172496502 /NCGR_PEP_ID=MMETSP1066-20121228/88372_1 /TAXON_ID=671091 /ORGANISM="Coscinodiscus wailesii, Strain CCMP2513" /LENGTH=85 /DNA_ID=CAMNT_0013268833 /DNA_START=1 /DNA_END=258 /DNA_ORIENTATION=+